MQKEKIEHLYFIDLLDQKLNILDDVKNNSNLVNNSVKELLSIKEYFKNNEWYFNSKEIWKIVFWQSLEQNRKKVEEIMLGIWKIKNLEFNNENNFYEFLTLKEKNLLEGIKNFDNFDMLDENYKYLLVFFISKWLIKEWEDFTFNISKSDRSLYNIENFEDLRNMLDKNNKIKEIFNIDEQYIIKLMKRWIKKEAAHHLPEIWQFYFVYLVSNWLLIEWIDFSYKEGENFESYKDFKVKDLKELRENISELKNNESISSENSYKIITCADWWPCVV